MTRHCLLVCIVAGAGLVSSDVRADQPSPASRSRPSRVVTKGVDPATVAAPKIDSPAAATALSAPLDLSPSVIKSAISAADEDYAPPTSRGTPFGSSPATARMKIDRAFEAAQIEGCGGSGALKFDPLPVWGDFVMGIFAVPYTLHAMATGRCKL